MADDLNEIIPYYVHTTYKSLTSCHSRWKSCILSPPFSAVLWCKWEQNPPLNQFLHLILWHAYSSSHSEFLLKSFAEIESFLTINISKYEMLQCAAASCGTTDILCHACESNKHLLFLDDYYPLLDMILWLSSTRGMYYQTQMQHVVAYNGLLKLFSQAQRHLDYFIICYWDVRMVKFNM
jgi:hypothetical protein